MAYLTNTTRPALIASGLTSRNTPTPVDGATTAQQKQPALWIMAGTDAIATVDGAGYISDAKDLGMQIGDLLLYILTSTSVIQMMTVMAISAAGAANLANGTAIDATVGD